MFDFIFITGILIVFFASLIMGKSFIMSNFNLKSKKDIILNTFLILIPSLIVFYIYIYPEFFEYNYDLEFIENKFNFSFLINLFVLIYLDFLIFLNFFLLKTKILYLLYFSIFIIFLFLRFYQEEPDFNITLKFNITMILLIICFYMIIVTFLNSKTLLYKK